MCMSKLTWIYEIAQLIADLKHEVIPFEEDICRPQIKRVITDLIN